MSATCSLPADIACPRAQAWWRGCVRDAAPGERETPRFHPNPRAPVDQSETFGLILRPNQKSAIGCCDQNRLRKPNQKHVSVVEFYNNNQIIQTTTRSIY